MNNLFNTIVLSVLTTCRHTRAIISHSPKPLAKVRAAIKNEIIESGIFPRSPKLLAKASQHHLPIPTHRDDAGSHIQETGISSSVRHPALDAGSLISKNRKNIEKLLFTLIGLLFTLNAFSQILYTDPNYLPGGVNVEPEIWFRPNEFSSYGSYSKWTESNVSSQSLNHLGNSQNNSFSVEDFFLQKYMTRMNGSEDIHYKNDESQNLTFLGEEFDLFFFGGGQSIPLSFYSLNNNSLLNIIRTNYEEGGMLKYKFDLSTEDAHSGFVHDSYTFNSTIETHINHYFFSEFASYNIHAERVGMNIVEFEVTEYSLVGGIMKKESFTLNVPNNFSLDGFKIAPSVTLLGEFILYDEAGFVENERKSILEYLNLKFGNENAGGYRTLRFGKKPFYQDLTILGRDGTEFQRTGKSNWLQISLPPSELINNKEHLAFAHAPVATAPVKESDSLLFEFPEIGGQYVYPLTMPYYVDLSRDGDLDTVVSKLTNITIDLEDPSLELVKENLNPNESLALLISNHQTSITENNYQIFPIGSREGLVEFENITIPDNSYIQLVVWSPPTCGIGDNITTVGAYSLGSKSQELFDYKTNEGKRLNYGEMITFSTDFRNAGGDPDERLAFDSEARAQKVVDGELTLIEQLDVEGVEEAQHTWCVQADINDITEIDFYLDKAMFPDSADIKGFLQYVLIINTPKGGRDVYPIEYHEVSREVGSVWYRFVAENVLIRPTSQYTEAGVNQEGQFITIGRLDDNDTLQHVVFDTIESFIDPTSRMPHEGVIQYYKPIYDAQAAVAYKNYITIPGDGIHYRSITQAPPNYDGEEVYWNLPWRRVTNNVQFYGDHGENYVDLFKGYAYTNGPGTEALELLTWTLDGDNNVLLDLDIDANGVSHHRYDATSYDLAPIAAIDKLLETNKDVGALQAYSNDTSSGYIPFNLYHRQTDGAAGVNLSIASNNPIPSQQGLYFTNPVAYYPVASLYNFYKTKLSAKAGDEFAAYPAINKPGVSLELTADEKQWRVGDYLRLTHNNGLNAFNNDLGSDTYEVYGKKWSVNVHTDTTSMHLAVDFDENTIPIPAGKLVLLLSQSQDMANATVFALEDDLTVTGGIDLAKGYYYLSIGRLIDACNLQGIEVATIGFGQSESFKSDTSGVLIVEHRFEGYDSFGKNEYMVFQGNNSVTDYNSISPVGGAPNLLQTNQSFCTSFTDTSQTRGVQFSVLASDLIAIVNWSASEYRVPAILVYRGSEIIESGLTLEDGVYKSAIINLKHGDEVRLGFIHNIADASYNHDPMGTGMALLGYNDGSGTTAQLSVESPRDLESREYLLLGHNNASYTQGTFTSNIAPIVNRTWKVQEIGDVGGVDVRFDLTGFNPPQDQEHFYVLLIDDNSQFSSPKTIALYESGANAYGAYNVLLNGGDYITLGYGQRVVIDTETPTCTLASGEIVSGSMCYIVCVDNETVDIHSNKPCPESIERVLLKVKASFGENFAPSSVDDTVSANFSVAINGFDDYTYTNQNEWFNNLQQVQFNLNELQPEQVYVLDITEAYDKLKTISVNGIAGSLDSRVQLESSIEKVVSVGVYQTEFPIVKTVDAQALDGSRKHRFEWTTNGCNIPSYQLQLLKLYNDNESNQNDETSVSATIDWSEALTVDVVEGEEAIDLSLAEGTGYYLWRVRPVGNLYPQGDSRNWGAWSLAADDSIVFTSPSETSNLSYALFYNEQGSEDSLNYIYARTFSEGSRIKESITYADGLARVHQQQTSLPSNLSKQIVSSQTVYDFAGRPALQSLPVPLGNGEFSYQSEMMTGADGVFRDQDFDSDSTFDNNHDTSLVQGGEIVQYYDQSDNLQIPSSEGFPYSRTLYYNDGSGRAKETGVPGANLAVGSGHTVRVVYEAAKESELIRMFGDEAPSAGTVLKQITFDQNNISSINYVDKSGKTIATSLQKNDLTDPNIMDALDSEINAGFSNKVSLENGSTVDLSITASTVYEFTEASDLAIDYSITPAQIAATCGTYCATCNYVVSFEIKDENDPLKETDEGWGTLRFHAETNAGGVVMNDQACTGANEITPTFVFDSTSTATQVAFPVFTDSLGASSTRIALPRGSYVVTKTITIDDSEAIEFADYVATQQKAAMDTFLLPVTNKLAEVGTNNITMMDVLAELEILRSGSHPDYTVSVMQLQTDTAGYSQQVDVTNTITGIEDYAEEMVFLINAADSTSGCCTVEIPVVFSTPNPCLNEGLGNAAMASSMVDMFLNELDEAFSLYNQSAEVALTPSIENIDLLAPEKIYFVAPYDTYLPVDTSLNPNYDNASFATVLENMLSESEAYNCEALWECMLTGATAIKSYAKDTINYGTQIKQALDDRKNELGAAYPNLPEDYTAPYYFLDNLILCAGTRFEGVIEPIENSQGLTLLKERPYKYVPYSFNYLGEKYDIMESSFCGLQEGMFPMPEEFDADWLSREILPHIAAGDDACVVGLPTCNYVTTDATNYKYVTSPYTWGRTEYEFLFMALKTLDGLGSVETLTVAEKNQLMEETAQEQTEDCIQACNDNYDLFLEKAKRAFDVDPDPNVYAWKGYDTGAGRPDLELSDLCCTAQSMVEACEEQCAFTVQYKDCNGVNVAYAAGTAEQIERLNSIKQGAVEVEMAIYDDQVHTKTVKQVTRPVKALIALTNELLEGYRTMDGNSIVANQSYDFSNFQAFADYNDVWRYNSTPGASYFKYVRVSATGDIQISEDNNIWVTTGIDFGTVAINEVISTSSLALDGANTVGYDVLDAALEIERLTTGSVVVDQSYGVEEDVVLTEEGDYWYDFEQSIPTSNVNPPVSCQCGDEEVLESELVEYIKDWEFSLCTPTQGSVSLKKGIKTHDEGFLLLVETVNLVGCSMKSGVTGGVGKSDLWLIKLNKMGEVQWDTSLFAKSSALGISVTEYDIINSRHVDGVLNYFVSVGRSNGESILFSIDENGSLLWYNVITGTNTTALTKKIVDRSDGGVSIYYSDQFDDSLLIVGTYFNGYVDLEPANNNTEYKRLDFDEVGIPYQNFSYGGAEYDSILVTASGRTIPNTQPMELNIISGAYKIRNGLTLVSGYSTALKGNEKSSDPLATSHSNWNVDRGYWFDHWLLLLNDSGNKLWDLTLGSDSVSDFECIVYVNEDYITLTGYRERGELHYYKIDYNGSVVEDRPHESYYPLLAPFNDYADGIIADNDLFYGGPLTSYYSGEFGFNIISPLSEYEGTIKVLGLDTLIWEIHPLYFKMDSSNIGLINTNANRVAKLNPNYNCQPQPITMRWTTPVPTMPGANPVTPPTVAEREQELSATLKASIDASVGQCYINLKEETEEAYRNTCLTQVVETQDVHTLSAIHHYTLYYYDRAGNLTRTVPPSGVDFSSESRNEETDHSYNTEYFYNSLGQLVSQTVPDHRKADGSTNGETKFIYNDEGLLRFSQNPEQAQSTPERYSYTKYDALGRITEVGELNGNFPTFQSFNNIQETDINTYGPDAYPTASSTGLQELTITEYNAPSAGAVTVNVKRTTPRSPLSVSRSPFSVLPQTFLDNRISHTYTDQDGDLNTSNDQTHTYYSYDPHGNVEWLLQRQPGLEDKVMVYHYDLISGNVLQVDYQPGYQDQYYHRYSYDADNRIESVETSKDGVIWETEAAYEYYAHGPLKRTVIGDDQVQGVDYTYTINGWLKAINHPVVDSRVHANATVLAQLDPGQDGNVASGSTIPRDAFGMELNYFEGDFQNASNLSPFDRDFKVFESITDEYVSFNPYSSNLTKRPLYNGNISHAAFMSQYVDNAPEPIDNQDMLLQAYRYDHLNRLKAATSSNYSASNWVDMNGLNSDYSYDANGNLTFLNRWSLTEKLDGLEYTLIGTGDNATNKLEYVVDHEGAKVDAQGFAVGDLASQSAGNYEYDAIGNLTKDVTEGIDAIEWTVYGKVKKIVKNDGSGSGDIITFDYDAAGNRVAKTIDRVDGTSNKTSYILDASGNQMAVYATDENNETKLEEQAIYGSERLGVTRREAVLLKDDMHVDGTSAFIDFDQEAFFHTTEVTNSPYGKAFDFAELFNNPAQYSHNDLAFVKIKTGDRIKLSFDTYTDELTTAFTNPSEVVVSAMGFDVNRNKDKQVFYNDIELATAEWKHNELIVGPITNAEASYARVFFQSNSGLAHYMDNLSVEVLSTEDVQYADEYVKEDFENYTGNGVVSTEEAYNGQQSMKFAAGASTYSNKYWVDVKAGDMVVTKLKAFVPANSTQANIQLRMNLYDASRTSWICSYNNSALQYKANNNEWGTLHNTQVFHQDGAVMIRVQAYSGHNADVYVDDMEISVIHASDIVNQGTGLFARRVGDKDYELKDHLGNVRATVSDRKFVNSAAQSFEVDDMAYVANRSIVDGNAVYHGNNIPSQAQNTQRKYLVLHEGDKVTYRCKYQLLSTDQNSFSVAFVSAKEDKDGNSLGYLPSQYIPKDTPNEWHAFEKSFTVQASDIPQGDAYIVAAVRVWDNESVEFYLDDIEILVESANGTLTTAGIVAEEDYAVDGTVESVSTLTLGKVKRLDLGNENFLISSKVSEGDIISVRGLLYDDAANIKLNVQYWNNGVVVDALNQYIVDTYTNQGSWQDIATKPFQIPAGVDEIKVYMYNSWLNNPTIYVDNMEIVKYEAQQAYVADLTSKQDYYPFGWTMPGRKFTGVQGNYRYGFQGQEHDEEVRGDWSTSVNYKYRMHDPRVGRFFAVDPLLKKYPHNSPFAFSENRLIDGVELEGLEFAKLEGLGGKENSKTVYSGFENQDEWRPGDELIYHIDPDVENLSTFTVYFSITSTSEDYYSATYYMDEKGGVPLFDVKSDKGEYIGTYNALWNESFPGLNLELYARGRDQFNGMSNPSSPSVSPSSGASVSKNESNISLSDVTGSIYYQAGTMGFDLMTGDKVTRNFSVIGGVGRSEFNSASSKIGGVFTGVSMLGNVDEMINKPKLRKVAVVDFGMSGIGLIPNPYTKGASMVYYFGNELISVGMYMFVNDLFTYDQVRNQVRATQSRGYDRMFE